MMRQQALELWGGVECTVNRVGGVYRDQVRRSGHHDRPEDIARFASIGFRAMRYPVLWERVAPAGLATADWTWTDERLELLRAADIRPIATLLHHGSGPPSTHLLDPEFPERFADYAGAVAARYPWLQDYTPINEPLTTARFSALYGHWYPHCHDDRSFVTALLNELRAVVLAMERIREINPAARLISTEDAGRTYSTPHLDRQAEFENHRRWLPVDLLTGRVSEAHPLWDWLVSCGALPRDLQWLADHQCSPDLVGLNYYLTSDRYLDERLSLHPASTHGGNGRERYADVDAVRVHEYEGPSHYRVLHDAWWRYRIPVALTEVHAGCTREDQLRWFASAWRAAELARSLDIDVRAVTMWSLLGAFDWNSLVVRSDDVYEVGAFDVRSVPPRRTALAALASDLASGTSPHALAVQPGWWLRNKRHAPGRPTLRFADHPADAPILIAGGTGMLESALVRACDARGLRAVALDRHQLDSTSPEEMLRVLDRWGPWAVVNAGGFTCVDDAETRAELCWRVNNTAAVNLAAAAVARRIRCATVSSDLVFDGCEKRAYVESDRPNPLNTYGLSMRAAEEGILRLDPDALIVRSGAFFAPDDQSSILTQALRDVSAGRETLMMDDVVVSPTYVPHLVDALLDLLIDGERGIWHLANRGQISWAHLVARVSQRLGLDASLIRGVPLAELGVTARRPLFSALDSERGSIMPSLEAAVEEYLVSAAGRWRERRSRPRAAAVR